MNEDLYNDLIYTFILTEPPVHMIVDIPTDVLYPNATKDRTGFVEFSVKVEHGRPIDFNWDVIRFNLRLSFGYIYCKKIFYFFSLLIDIFVYK